MNSSNPQKTREEVEALKEEWKRDSCWDIETTEGFEEYHDELKAFSVAKKLEWTEAHERSMHQARQISPHRNAYPIHELEGGVMGVSNSKSGISIRALLAGQIMAGIVSSSTQSFSKPIDSAKKAVEYTDALIAELNK